MKRFFFDPYVIVLHCYTLFIVLVCGLLLSCETTVQRRNTVHAIDGEHWQEVTIEGCVYLMRFHQFTHKGNCPNRIHCYNPEAK